MLMINLDQSYYDRLRKTSSKFDFSPFQMSFSSLPAIPPAAGLSRSNLLLVPILDGRYLCNSKIAHWRLWLVES
ncbi:hypothetical protein AAHA92_19970 [Salvia divinorum]|uniref:Uncharacterized protein n=1 Tax=Salvia divinorum TaxID=28513 RepID=A0ABD1GFP9_SALDI